MIIKAGLEDEAPTGSSVKKLKLQTHSGDYSSTALIIFSHPP